MRGLVGRAEIGRGEEDIKCRIVLGVTGTDLLDIWSGVWTYPLN